MVPIAKEEIAGGIEVELASERRVGIDPLNALESAPFTEPDGFRVVVFEIVGRHRVHDHESSTGVLDLIPELEDEPTSESTPGIQCFEGRVIDRRGLGNIP